MARSAPRSIMIPAAVGILLTLVGCASNATRLEVRAEPASAMVFARTPDGQTIRPRGEPPTFRLRFRDPSQSVFTIVATPVGAEAEQFLETTFPVSESGLHASRQIRPHPSTRNAHVLTLPLQRKAYEDLPFVEVVLDVRDGWTTVLTTRRAYDDVTERGGVAPQRVARLPELTGLRGMSMSPDGDRMVYAIAEAEGLSESAESSEAFGVRTQDRNGDQSAARRRAAARAAADSTSEQNLVTRSNLRGIRLAGGGIEQITVDGFYDFDPAFTSDGQHILFASNRRNMNASDILRIRSTARAGGIQNIYTDPQGHWLVRPTQGADGTIAFNMIPAPRPGDRGGEARPPEIWTIGGPGRFPTQVTVGLQPAISPSGDKIAFIRNGNLWVCRVDGTGETQLTTDADRILQDYLASLPNDEARERFIRNELDRTFFPYSHPVWSPDGRFIVYTSMQGQDPTGRRQEDIWIMDADGGMREQLTTNPSTDRYPLVSPDGRNIYFLSNRGRAWAIWRIPAPEFMRAE